MGYAEKLRDPRWQKRRLQIFERDLWMCQLCGDNQSTLAVHHIWYSGEPWEAPDDALVTLCGDCHENNPPQPLSPFRVEEDAQREIDQRRAAAEDDMDFMSYAFEMDNFYAWYPITLREALAFTSSSPLEATD